MLTDDALKALWDSTAALHERFQTNNDNVEAQMRVFFEEVYEFSQATTTEHVWNGWNSDAMEEGTDVIVTVISVLQAMDVDLARLTEAIATVVRKNNAKTHETHYVHPKSGKITRREQP